LLATARERGAVAIDMETSALFAAASANGIEAAAVLVVADLLLEEWQPPVDPSLIQSLLRRVAAVAARCLRP
jgi:purine-nucleoside phosphorylase